MKIVRVSLLAAIPFVALNLGFAPPMLAQTAAPELAAMGEWSAAKTYAKDDIVTARGSAWISLKPGNKNQIPGQTSPSTATWWKLFARGFNPTGAWSNATKYQPDDLVTQSGQTYRAKLTNTNKPVTNTTNWELLAAKGAPGPNTGVPSGTSNAPGISFNGDANTGIYSPEAGKIAIVEDGVRFMHNIGFDNTGLGLNALGINSSGSWNTAVGGSALAVSVSGAANTALGSYALTANTSGNDNVAIGYSAMSSNTTGARKIAIGSEALSTDTNNTSNDGSIAIGYQALKLSNPQIGSNVAIGYQAMTVSNTGSNNIAIGPGALASNTTGHYNTAVGGPGTLGANQVGVGNTAIGAGSLGNTAAHQNTAVGYGALIPNTSGSNNIAIGYLAGNSVGSAPSNIIMIGTAGVNGDSGVIRIGTAGTHTSAFITGIYNATSASGIPVYVNSDGQLGTGTSSRRYKDDIAAIGGAEPMLARMRPVTFRYKEADTDGSKPRQYGLIAEEVEQISPDLVAYNKDGSVETVRYQFLPPLLLAGYQSQQKTIAAQADRIEALEDRLRRLEALLPQTKAAALQ